MECPPMSHRRSAHAAFTLVELLVVISIIAVLLALLLPAVQKIRDVGPRTKAVQEINDLAAACQTFKSKYGFYPPSTFTYPTNPSDPNNAFLIQMFPRWNPSTALVTFPSGTISGSQCLVYFLGGPLGTGWAIDAPVAPSQGSTNKNVFYDFPAARVNSVGAFLDPWGTPYAYLASGSGGLYGSNGYYPTVINPFNPVVPVPNQNVTFYQTATTTPNVFKPINQGSVQIISAGKNMTFGPGGVWTPGGTNYTQNAAGYDDLANFNGGVQLGVVGN